MRVLILTTHFNVGGITRYVINLSKGLSILGNKVYVGSSGGEWLNKLEELGIEHIYLPINTKSILSYKVFLSLFKLRSFLKKEKIDVIHANTRVTQFLAYLIYKIYKIRYVCTFHGFYRHIFLRRIIKFAGLKSIAVSYAVRDYLIKVLGFSPSLVKVVYNGVDLENLKKKKRLKKDLGLKEQDIVIGMLGRISQEKGHVFALEALEPLLNKYPIYFFICGKGRLRKILEDRIKNSKLAQRVKFLDIEGEKFLDLIDILLVPSSQEGLGFTVLESFAKGVCVIASERGGLRELIKDGYNGLIFSPYRPEYLKDKIELLLKDSSLIKTLGEQAQKEVEKFSFIEMAKNTEEIYRSVL